MTYRMSLISAGSISLKITFKLLDLNYIIIIKL
jgi:hypothetical protein